MFKLFKKKPINYYIELGEIDGIKSIVNDFYTTMENAKWARECLYIHELDSNNKVSSESKEKLVAFLSGWLGGPNLFIEKFGPPKMRARHLHVKISQLHADQWLKCMESALKKQKIKRSTRLGFLKSCKALTIRIINS